MKVKIHGETFDTIIAATCLAEYGNIVSLADLCQRKVTTNQWLENEPGLYHRLNKNERLARFFYGCKFSGQIHWIFDRSCSDLISKCIKLIQLEQPKLFIISSHHPIGYFKKLVDEIKKYSYQHEVYEPMMAMVPFTAREGRGLNDFEYPELLIVGTEQSASLPMVKKFLLPFIRQSTKFMPVSGTEAEMIRSSIAAMLATRLSFINEVAALSESIGADVEIIREAMSSDSRVGGEYLTPSCGYGGLTLPLELRNLREKLSSGAGAQLLSAVEETNQQQKELLFRKVWQYFNADIKGKKIAIWGGAFKAGVASVDNSPIHELLRAFWAQGASISLYDLKAGPILQNLYIREPLFEVVDNAYKVLDAADALLIVTDHKEFVGADFKLVRQKVNTPVIFDGRNILDALHMEDYGIEYYGIGHGKAL